MCVCVEQRHVLGMKINSHPKMRKGTLQVVASNKKQKNFAEKVSDTIGGCEQMIYTKAEVK